MVQLCAECAKACRILEVEETVEACRLAKPYPSTFFAFCWQVQFSLLQFASWTCIGQWNVFHCLKLCMEAGAGGVGSLARLLIQDHCNSSLLQKLSFSFFKSLYDPQNIKTAKVHCIKIEVISNSQHKYIISFTLENFRSLESVNSSVSKKMLLLQDSCFRFKQKQSTLLFVQKWAIRKTPLRVRQRSGAVSFLSISKSSPKSFFLLRRCYSAD